MIPNPSQKSLASNGTSASDLSLFEQHLPQEPQRFTVELNKGSRVAVTARSPTRHGKYSFTVLPQVKSPRSRENSPHKTNSPLHTLHEADDIVDEHYQFLTGRTHFRHQRLSHYTSGRQFPALVSPRILPSFKRAAETANRVNDENALVKLPSDAPEKVTKEKAFVKTTVSAVRHRHVRKCVIGKPSHHVLPFVPSGNRRKDIEPSKGLHDDYDAARELEIDESKRSRDRRLGGAFVPSCARPKQKSLGPLSFCRSQMRSISPPPAFRMRADTDVSEAGAAEQEPDGLEVETADAFISEGGEALGDAGSIASPSPRNSQRMLQQPGALNRSTSNLKSGADRKPRESSGGIPLLDFGMKEDSMHQAMKNFELKESETKETEEASMTTFKKLSDEGKIHKDDMPKALGLLDFSNPNAEWIDAAFEKVSKYVTIGLHEFLGFLKAYEVLQRAAYRKEFHASDEDGSGTVEAAELFELMKKLGHEPMRHVLNEVIDEVDDNKNGSLDFTEFEAVMDILRTRQGFSKYEYEEIFTLFHRFDRDKSGTMDTKEIHLALRWLGFHFPDPEADAIITEVDEDQSGQIDVGEWFVCMRKVREKKIQKLKEVMAASDVDHDGQIQRSGHEVSELQSLLRSMGYVPDFDAVKESAADADIQPDDNDLDLGELWRLLAVYREVEGLNREDLKYVEGAFNKYAVVEKDENGETIDETLELDVSDMGRVVRSIGYSLDFETQRDLTNKVDIDGSGRLDEREFRKMIRMVHEKDIELFRLAFEEALKLSEIAAAKKLADRSRTAKFEPPVLAASPLALSVPQAIMGLKRVSCSDNAKVMESFFSKDATEDGQIDFYEFVQAGIRSRRMARAAFRENGGFTKDQIKELRVSFAKFDSDGSGEITGSECIYLFEEEFPMISNDPTRRPQLIQLLKDADEDGNGSLDFKDFLRIMRHLRDMQDQLRIGKELEAVSTTKFSPPEVAEFRELFIAAGDGMKELGFGEVKELLKCIVPMGTKNVEVLRTKFAEMAAQQNGVVGDAELLDFPEFLWLMRNLIDMDFAGMSGRADAIVAEEVGHD